MADQVQLRGGTTAEHATFTGAVREVTVDTSKKTAVIHDGVTAGGFPLLRQDMANVSAATAIAALGLATVAQTLSNKTLDSSCNISGASIGIYGIQFTKNKLINGEVTRINQRAFNGTWSGNSVWETQPATIAGKEAAYGYDMWFRSNAARSDGTGASENMGTWIEAGNYHPSTVHTLSGTGVTTTNITSPASGDWKIVVAQGATNVQVEEGTVATPFELRSIRYELAECQRYYENWDAIVDSFGAESFTPHQRISFAVTKRVTPQLSHSTGGTYGSWSSLSYAASGPSGYTLYINGPAAGSNTWSGTMYASAVI